MDANDARTLRSLATRALLGARLPRFPRTHVVRPGAVSTKVRAA